MIDDLGLSSRTLTWFWLAIYKITNALIFEFMNYCSYVVVRDTSSGLKRLTSKDDMYLV